MKTPTIRAYLGGSFDPIHLGHLQMAAAVLARLPEAFVYLLPTAGNPFKAAPTDNDTRLTLLKLALTAMPDTKTLAIEPLELHRTPPVFTIDTLHTLRATFTDDTLIFIIGADSLASLPRWKDSQTLMQSVKFWVFARPEFAETLPNPPAELPIFTDLSAFLASDTGIFIDDTPISAISSSQVRALFAKNDKDAAKKLLPEAVFAYICQHKLYQSGASVL